MRTTIGVWLKRVAVGIGLLVALAALLVGAGLAFRAWDALRAPPLEAWHTFVPDEPDADAIDAMDWAAYLRSGGAALRRRKAGGLPRSG